MSWNGTGTYSRGYPSWSNDAANNLPISSTKFDQEDNDFAAGINNCLTIDGQNSPTAPLVWTTAAAAVITLLRQTNGVGFSVGRSTGTNNPNFQVVVTDGIGVQLNLTSSQTLSLGIAGTDVLKVTAAGVQFVGTTTFNDGNSATPGIAFLAHPGTGLWEDGSGNLGVSTAGVNRITVGTNGAVTIASTGASSVNLVVGDTTGATNQVSAAIGNWRLAVGSYISAGYTELVSLASQPVYIGTTAAFNVNLCTNSVGRLAISSTGLVTIGAPSGAGAALSLTGAANSYTAVFQSSLTTGQAYGLDIAAGTNATDQSLIVQNAAGSVNYFRVRGDGKVQATDDGLTGLIDVGWRDIPVNAQNGSYTCVSSDRGKGIVSNNAGASTYTIPAGLPVGTVISFANYGTTALSIACAQTLVLAAVGTTGTRTLSATYGVASAWQHVSGTWIISGSGLT